MVNSNSRHNLSNTTCILLSLGFVFSSVMFLDLELLWEKLHTMFSDIVTLYQKFGETNIIQRSCWQHSLKVSCWKRSNFIWYLVLIVYHSLEPKLFCDWQLICFLGKWVLTKDYIIHSAKSGRWLDETTYEWGYKIEKDSHYSPQMQSAPKRWREELKRTGAPGAFHRWKVVLLVRADKRSDSLVR